MVHPPLPPPVEAGRRLLGDFSIWVFVLGDMAFFAVYFVIFMIYRVQERSVFLPSQGHLDLAAGAVNTLLLLASSRFVALGVRAVRNGDLLPAQRLMLQGAACGTAFVALKAYEWSSLVGGGFTLRRNDFFMFYFMLTGLHLFHVLLGLGLLGLATIGMRRVGPIPAPSVETAAVFWHMVDLIWVVIFALFYVMR